MYCTNWMSKIHHLQRIKDMNLALKYTETWTFKWLKLKFRQVLSMNFARGTTERRNCENSELRILGIFSNYWSSDFLLPVSKTFFVNKPQSFVYGDLRRNFTIFIRFNQDSHVSDNVHGCSVNKLKFLSSFLARQSSEYNLIITVLLLPFRMWSITSASIDHLTTYHSVLVFWLYLARYVCDN